METLGGMVKRTARRSHWMDMTDRQDSRLAQI
jgi:hypothetical protein